MRSLIRATGVLVLACGLIACDTTQPLQVESQDFTLEMDTFGAIVRRFYLYEVYIDNDGDDAPDDGNVYPFCISIFGPDPDPNDNIPPPLLTTSATSVPANYTVEVTVLRAGETVAETITSGAATTTPDANRTGYDVGNVVAAVPQRNPVFVDPNTYKFRNVGGVSEASRLAMMSTTNPLSEADPATYGDVGSGRCSVIYPGDPVLDEPSGSSYPLRLTLHKGDTLTVRARSASAPPLGLTLQPGSLLGLRSSLKLGGRSVTVQGRTASALGPGEDLTFTFTPL
jgi:hypothetical protein